MEARPTRPMTDVETLAERVRTVERAVTDGDHTFPAVDDLAELTSRVEALEQQVTELDERTAELEAATQALRGYVGNVRSVNERVERRADTALSATERLERRLDGDDRAVSEHDPGAEQSAGPDDRVCERHVEGAADGDRRASGPSDRHAPSDDGSAAVDSDGGPDTDESDDAGLLEGIRALL